MIIFSMMKRHWETIKIILGFVLFLAFAYFVIENSGIIDEQFIESYGLAGILVAAIISNATIFIILPAVEGLLFIFSERYASSFAEVIAYSIAAGLGAAIGEMTSYIMGLLGIKAAEKAKNKEFQKIGRITELVGKKGVIFIFLGSLTPFPFDIIGIACGVMKYDVKRFFVAALAGKVVRFFLIGFAAYYGIGFVKDFFFF